jgi:hypothetical protein
MMRGWRPESFIHSVIQSFIHSVNHSDIQSFSHSVIQSFSHSVIHSFIRSFSHSVYVIIDACMHVCYLPTYPHCRLFEKCTSCRC